MEDISMLKNENYECFPLIWDTDYFGVKSARVILKSAISKLDQVKIMDYCKGFEFITISNLSNHKDNNYWLGKNTSAFLTDINAQFTKNIDMEPKILDASTEIYNSYAYNEQVTDIARTAFTYSRFFNDPALKQKQAKDIYLHWTSNAFDNPDKYFAICKRDNVVAGYLLFSVNAELSYATIELIAVNEFYTGRNVGKSLIAAIEAFAYRENLKSIKVGTQIDNITANIFYNKCGFTYTSCSSIYHYWPNIKVD